MRTLQKVTVRKAEGRNPLPPPAICSNWDEIQAILRSWSYDAPKDGGGYLKCDVEAIFDDGSEYRGRYDMTWTGRNTSGESLQQQVERRME